MVRFHLILVCAAVFLLAAGYANAECGQKKCDKQGTVAKPCCAKAEQKPCCAKAEQKPCCLKGEGKAAPAEKAAAAERSDVLYVCACETGCDCKTVSKSPGKCACGKDLRWHHIVRVEGDDVLLCGCGEGCRCELSQTDPTKCTCGNSVKRVSLKDSGLFFCNCGGSCSCNTVSDEPGECGCGMQLKPA